MIRSMTGFAGEERQFEFGRLAWEIRSVNHRYLEFSMRLPDEFRVLDPAIRKCLGQHISRGKLDVTLRYHAASDDSASRLTLNKALARRLLDLHQGLGELDGRPQAPDLTRLMRWPGLIEESITDPEPLHAAALDLLTEAARGLQAARGREGEQMSAAISLRIDAVQEWTGQIRQWLPEIRDGLRQKLLDRIADLPQPLEPGRIEQEVAMLSQKIDVDEELDRLDAHVLEVRRILTMDEPVGRRLDFLMQEFNRESNTLSSKSIDQRTSQAAVELKVLIEQMREQVQNVE
jgi:uncharacterized protein (TIGR00255 family)